MTGPQPGDIYVDIGSTVEETSFMFMVLAPSPDGNNSVIIMWLRNPVYVGQIRQRSVININDYYFKAACLSDEM